MKLKQVQIPNSLATFIMERISPIHQDYINSQIQSVKFLGVPQKFGIKELMISCYTQGLQDAEAAIKQTKKLKLTQSK